MKPKEVKGDNLKNDWMSFWVEIENKDKEENRF